MLTSGLYATVVEIDDDTVTVQAAPGVELRYAKAAVLRVLPDPTETDEPDADDHDGGNDGESGPVP